MLDHALGVTELYAYTSDGLRVATSQYLNSALQKTKYNVYNDARQLVSEYVLAPSGSPVTMAMVKSLAATSGPNLTAQISYTGATGLLTGATVTLGGSYTADCPVTRVTYGWNFGDGTTLNSQTATSVTHTYITQGVYTVTLTVSPVGTQNPSCTNTKVPATLVFTIVNQPAISTFTCSASSLTVGQPFSFSYSTSNATALSINGTVVGGTSASWTATATTSFVLKATNTLNGVTFSVFSTPLTVTVLPDPTAPNITNFSAAAVRISNADANRIKATGKALDKVAAQTGKSMLAIEFDLKTIKRLAAENKAEKAGAKDSGSGSAASSDSCSSSGASAALDKALTAIGVVAGGIEQAAEKTTSLAKGAHLTGAITGGLSTYSDLNKVSTGEMGVGKAMLNFGMLLVGGAGVPGFIVSSVYSGVDSFYPGGTSGLANDSLHSAAENQKTIGQSSHESYPSSKGWKDD